MGWAWAAASGAPLGLLIALAVWPEPSRGALLVATLTAAFGLVVVVDRLSRLGGPDGDRRGRLIRAASAGWLAVPPLGAAWLQLPPPPAPWVALVLATLVLTLARASRGSGPPEGLAGHAIRLVLSCVVATALVVAAAGALALREEEPLASDEEFAEAVLDIDAGVAMRPDPNCEERVRRTALLLDRGAHPRLSPDGAFVWFDAETSGGRRQVHRLDRRSGDVLCWTCGEPGSNRRPSPHPAGTAVVFDTDRHRTAWSPANTEVHVVSAVERPRRKSRRLTFDSAPDDHGIYDPSGRGVVWSRADSAGFAVVRAAIQTGHGGVLLGPVRVLARGGARWIAPLHWSLDARALVIGSGPGEGRVAATLFDPAVGTSTSLGADAAAPGSVSTSADGSRIGVATTRPRGMCAFTPASVGFLMGRVQAAWPALRAAFRRAGSGVRVGPSSGPLVSLDLGDEGDWGAPTGLSLAPDGSAFVLGQRRRTSGAARERLLWVELACATPWSGGGPGDDADAPVQAGRPLR